MSSVISNKERVCWLDGDNEDRQLLKAQVGGRRKEMGVLYQQRGTPQRALRAACQNPFSLGGVLVWAKLSSETIVIPAGRSDAETSASRG
ncbi:hypothetical protein E4U52_005376 [Claviceps spartinae]|nr:hypothetical protein E4U52_005376 [Claviceps spartinae]